MRTATHQKCSGSDLDRLIAKLGSHRPFLVAFAKRLGASHADAQDCAQVALTKGWLHLDQFEGNDYDVALRKWLGTILKNQFFSAIRRDRVAAKYLKSMLAEPTCECRGEASYEFDRVMRAASSLPPCQRDVVSDLLDGLDYQQSAEHRGIPIGTVKSRLFRAREALQVVA
jgi:RNA polymerase sigma-70 factor (ECF subfamily)